MDDDRFEVYLTEWIIALYEEVEKSYRSLFDDSEQRDRYLRKLAAAYIANEEAALDECEIRSITPEHVCAIMNDYDGLEAIWLENQKDAEESYYEDLVEEEYRYEYA